MNNLKETPKFKSELEEQEFWENNDSTEYIDWNKATTYNMKLKLNKTPETLQDILDNLKYLWEENKRLKKNLRELRKKLKEFGNP